ncbi:DUF2231 domain-containing protein [Mycobacterium sp. pUA109]|uniref:DUF2231 domain-containing protein n=1 Tax=Mycobacterium sp. pUA109 TaxID=3238982 RepID=UPI00351AF631
MTTFHGLPVHILLNHFIIVLAPLTALLAIVAALWPAARRRLVWLLVALAAVTVALTPPTVRAGAWFAEHVDSSPTLTTHMNLGDTTIYCSVALLVVAALLAVTHVRQQRGRRPSPVVQGLIAVLVIAASVAVLVQVYRIGESGARAAWGSFAAAAAP